MLKYLIGAAVVLVYLLAPQPDPLCFDDQPCATGSQSHGAGFILEDEPGWNCETMGNLTC